MKKQFFIMSVFMYSATLYAGSSRWESEGSGLEDIESGGVSAGSVMINSVGSRASRNKNQRLTWQAMRTFEKLAPDLSISLRQTLIATMVADFEIRNDGAHFDAQDIAEALLTTLSGHVIKINAEHRAEYARLETQHQAAIAEKERAHQDEKAIQERLHKDLYGMLQKTNQEQKDELEELKNARCCGF